MSYQIELIVYIYFRFDCIFILYIFDENGWFKCIYQYILVVFVIQLCVMDILIRNWYILIQVIFGNRYGRNSYIGVLEI